MFLLLINLKDKIMNSCTFIAKIVSTPQQRLITGDICLVETRIQIAKLWNKKGFDQFQISIWGNLGKDFIKYYRVGDYIIINGVLNFKEIKSGNLFKKETKMTVLDYYPFLLTD